MTNIDNSVAQSNRTALPALSPNKIIIAYRGIIHRLERPLAVYLI